MRKGAGGRSSQKVELKRISSQEDMNSILQDSDENQWKSPQQGNEILDLHFRKTSLMRVMGGMVGAELTDP
jgi:hypothetical protein